MNADLKIGIRPAPKQTAEAATAAEGRDDASLQRQRSVFTEDAGSIVPVDQPPGHCADLIRGIEFLGSYSTT